MEVILELVGVVEGDGLARPHGAASPDDAVADGQAPEVAGVDEPRGPELAAGDVEVAHGAGQAGVGDGHAVARHAARPPRRLGLRHHHGVQGALVRRRRPPPLLLRRHRLHSSCRCMSCACIMSATRHQQL